MIVPRIPIVMAPLVFGWIWPNKSKENKTMNTNGFGLIVLPEKKEWATVIFLCGMFKTLRNGVSNIPVVRYFVKAFKANNVFPDFHNPSVADIGIINDFQGI